MRIVLMGPPGAGKGTQGARLADREGIPRYATGDMLRAARREGTEMGRKARRFMDAGDLVPDEVILGIVREALERPEARDGFVLDGFPRTVEQAEGLEDVLEDLDDSLDAVISLVVPEEELVRRLTARRVCAACGAVTRVDAADDGCPTCGGELEQREDDRPETVRRRLEVYREQTEPVLAWYRESELPVLEIDGTGSVREVEARLREKLAP